MLHILSALALLSGAYLPQGQTIFVQVAPAPRAADEALRSPNQDRAVLLIHGLFVHPFNADNIGKAVFHSWQKPGSRVVKQLARESDVYAFGYGQDIAVDDIAAGPGFAQAIGRLRELGYRSIVLIGHSAGGLIARQFVEDNPECGVTKVIQLCAPNGGSSWADWGAVMPSQSAFLYSLTKEGRQMTLRVRADRKVPKNVQFACIIGDGLGVGDGLVQCRCQWTEDLQKQGIPAYGIAVTHWQAIHVPAAAQLMADLVRQDQPRWTARAVALTRHQLLGD